MKLLEQQAQKRLGGRIPGVFVRQAWAVLRGAVKRFSLIDGDQWAGAFAFSAFSALFPLIVLFVTIASTFIDHERAGEEVIAYVETYVPIGGDMQSYIFNTIAGVAKVRGTAGLIAVGMLVWASMQFFSTLICAANRAWGNHVNSLWRLPLKSLAFLAMMVLAVLVGIVTPVVAKTLKDRVFSSHDMSSWFYPLVSFAIPVVVTFIGLSLFYKLAPRRHTRFSEVWVAALSATVILQAAESLFVVYIKNFAALNVVYGAFGGIIALLLWIYYSGYIFIFGACLCAAQAELNESSVKTAHRSAA